ncbi:MAG: Stp1/IreP family PP2C-type Ser/Thr phosphatase [Ruminococcaceae bacterium]|nr:Stp1/IreP family PP2C-type Ser/Thr phosphatase [Oscillospiraceae bacterium]HHV31695.1 Stp1/IreP family PP2C-type Ser/Thr phosphatase [Clostridiales bacterium]
MKVYTKSDIGLVRSSNQDAYNDGILPDQSAWVVVCDGMGGANGGAVASSVAVRKISEHMVSNYKQGLSDSMIKELILSSIVNANMEVHNMASSDTELSGMGTTVVVALISNGTAHIAHAGDSRAYLITPDEIRQLTTDHSMVQEMVNNGDLTEQQARQHPQKNIITRALGVENSIEIDYCEIPFLQGSKLLICTDGLTNYVEAEQIFQLSRKVDGGALTEQLIELAKNSGGGDNITVAIVEN